MICLIGIVLMLGWAAFMFHLLGRIERLEAALPHECRYCRGTQYTGSVEFHESICYLNPRRRQA